MTGAVRGRLSEGRWHFQHGPIDCIVSAEGDAAAVQAGVERAWQRFGSVLAELVDELPALRTDLSSSAGRALCVHGPVARRMVEACRPQAARHGFLTAMAAVAGSVADELLATLVGPGIERAYVNNGGDIALHLGEGASFDVGLVANVAHGLAGLPLDGCLRIDAGSGIGGVATSGWRGRSFSLGIADAVTVLARDGARADAVATVIANAVDADAAGIVRVPAASIRDDSDLGDRLVVIGVPGLERKHVEQALARGADVARGEVAAGRIIAAVLTLQQRFVVVDGRPSREVAAPCLPHRPPLFAPAPVALPLAAAPC